MVHTRGKGEGNRGGEGVIAWYTLVHVQAHTHTL